MKNLSYIDELGAVGAAKSASAWIDAMGNIPAPASEKTRRNRANNALHAISRTYHCGLPIAEIDSILTANGFEATEPAIYCGAEGSSHEKIGPNSWLSFTWYKMESGRYEITTYLS